MAAKEKTEDVLRRIHLLFQKALPYNDSKRSVVIDKSDMMNLLKELNDCIFDMQDEFEMTTASRDKADRKQAKQNESMVFEARRKADDIYAASVLYTDRALTEVEDSIDEAQKRMQAVHEELMRQFAEKKHEVKSNRLELKSTLQDLIDTQKYTNLIDEENKRLRKEKEAGEKAMGVAHSSMDSAPSYGDAKPEIKINEDYFRANGLLPDDDIDMEQPEAQPAARESKDAADMIADETIAAAVEQMTGEPVKKKGFSFFKK